LATAPIFNVISGSAVKRAIDANRQKVFEAVETAYRLHAAGESVNPASCFLRYPDNITARIIALPAHLGGEVKKSGIKWISSFPANRYGNLARASAVQILNDATTGYPLACIEASLISATRTAASAALAAEHLSPAPFAGTLSVIGTGLIARSTIEWLIFRNWKFRKINLFDVDRKEAEQLATWLRDQHGLETELHSGPETALRDASLILFTTTAPEPYLADEKLFVHAPTVLHLSLRDIAVNVILASQNIVDDIEHVLKANTSLHLAEAASGSRDFIGGNLVDVLDGKLMPDLGKARIFSPFGLGILDIAVSDLILREALTSGTALAIPDFFSNSVRW
jgi:N-[(2S)-2-amino-2-carboxyethyl]-L-glutamate dehydrogenase